MKKLLCALLVLGLIIAMSACINDEEATNMDHLTPNDSTLTK